MQLYELLVILRLEKKTRKIGDTISLVSSDRNQIPSMDSDTTSMSNATVKSPDLTSSSVENNLRSMIHIKSIVQLKDKIFDIVFGNYGNRVRKKVKSGWTGRVNGVLWKEFELSCTWSFKRASYREHDIIYCGKCTNKGCSAEVNGLLEHGSSSNHRKLF